MSKTFALAVSFAVVMSVTTSAQWNQWRGPARDGSAPPVLATIAGAKQIVTLTDKSVVGVSTADGVILWSFPFPDEWNENIVTPIVIGDMVIVSGTRQGTRALRVTREGAALTALEIVELLIQET